MDRESEPTLEELWRVAKVRFKDRTGLSLDQQTTGTSKSCLDLVENTLKPDINLPSSAKKPSRAEKAKQSGIYVIKCLKLLSGVAAQGADFMPFPASSLCFKALHILLNIPEEMQQFHGALAGMFDEIGPSLSMFRIYERTSQFEEIELELKHAIHKVMISFVDVCAVYIQLRNTGGWRRFLTTTKVVLLQDDSGVKAALADFRAQVSAHSSIQATQELKTILETNSGVSKLLNEAAETKEQVGRIFFDVGTLKNAEDKRESEKSKKERQEKLKKYLGLQDGGLSASEDMRNKLYDGIVSGTASWFANRDEHPEFHSWIEWSNAESNALLLLTGDQNTGKSVIMSAIVWNLKSKYKGAAQSLRTLITSYFFPTFSVKKGDESKRPVETALKWIAIQLADQDDTYADSLVQACERLPDARRYLKEATCADLWQFLHLDSPKPNTIQFIVLDGLDGLPDSFRAARDELLDIMRRHPRESLSRVLVSMRGFPGEGNQRTPSIDIEKHSSEDLGKYIDHKLKERDLFQDLDDDSLELRSTIRKGIVGRVNGNYLKAATALDQIEILVESNGSRDGIDRILEDCNKDERAISETLINQLERRLRAEEIEELSELLVWTIYGWDTFSIEQLEAALFLRFQKSTLLRLKKKLEGKYSGVFNLSGGDSSAATVQVADGLADLLQKDRMQIRTMDDTPKFSATITISKADRESVQSFLWSLAQEAGRDNFGFYRLATEGSMKGHIQVNEINAHLGILRSTFKFLASEPDTRTARIAPYLLGRLPHHLGSLEARRLDGLSLAEKREIGNGLWELFSSGEIVEIHWDSCGDVYWYDRESEVAIFRRWLADPEVVGHLGRFARKQLRDIEADPNPNQALLFQITKTVAFQWIRRDESDVGRPFRWLRGFLALEPATERDGRSERDDKTISEASFSRFKDDSVAAVAKWCKEMLPVKKEDDIWYDRLGQTYIYLNDHARAIPMLRRALELGTKSVRRYERLAVSLAESEQYSEACTEIHEAIKLLEREDADNAERSNLFLYLAEWQTAIDEPTKAHEYLEKALEREPDNSKVRYSLLKLYLDSDRQGEAEQLFDELLGLSGGPHEPGQLSRVLTHLFVEIADGDENEWLFGSCASLARRHPSYFNAFLNEIDLAIDMAVNGTGSSEESIASLLRVYKGAAMYHFNPAKAPLVDSAVEAWNSCLQTNGNWVHNWLAHPKAARLISAHHFECARAATNIDDQTEHVRKLRSITSQEFSHGISPAKSYLASYYMLSNDPRSARSILQASTESAIGMLTDEYDFNDWAGYRMLSHTLLKSGDLLNALSVFSLRLPPPTEGNVMRWLLDFTEQPAQDLSSNLIELMEEDHTLELLTDQIKFIIEQVDRNIAELDSANQYGDLTTAATTLGSQEKPKAANDMSSAPTSLPPSQSSSEIRKAYETIKSTLLEKTKDSKCTACDYPCDGCGQVWGPDSSVNICIYCDQVGFCDGCLEKVKKGNLETTILWGWLCRADHKWLYLPKVGKEDYIQALQGKVRVGGKLAVDRRVGGELVDFNEWITGLKTSWASFKEESPAPLVAHGHPKVAKTLDRALSLP